MIQGAEPFIPEEDRKEMLMGIQEIIKSGQFSLGKHLEEFENSVCKMAGTQFALGVNSCGTGLELIFEALEIKERKSSYRLRLFWLLPTQLHGLEANLFLQTSTPSNLSLTCASIENCITENTIAVAIVHMFGAISHEISEVRIL